jgi:predicted AAA+ superfamily ATPase
MVEALRAEPHECYFWRTHTGAELDLLIIRGKRRIGVEVKRTSAPTITPSMRNALVDLKLTEFHVVHAGRETFPLSKEIQAVAVQDILTVIKPLA